MVFKDHTMDFDREDNRKGDTEDWGLIFQSTDLSVEFANKVLANLNEGIIMTDRLGNICYVNRAFCSICGYDREELVGQNPRVLKSNLHNRVFYDEMWKIIAEKGQWSGQIWNRHKSGKLYLQKLYIMAINHENSEMIKYVGVTTDISAQEKLQRDLIRAGNLQRTLLPLPIKQENLIVKALYHPSDYISGDHYDYFWDEDNETLSGYLIDLMGHGITAAIQTSILRVLFRERFTKDRTLSQTLMDVNNELNNYLLEDFFAAVFLFRLDLRTRTFSFSSAGINKFLKLNQSGEVTKITLEGMYLGIMKDVAFEERELCIQPGETLFLLTDGLMDVLEQVGLEKLSGDYGDSYKFLTKIGETRLKDDASVIGIHLPMSYNY